MMLIHQRVFSTFTLDFSHPFYVLHPSNSHGIHFFDGIGFVAWRKSMLVSLSRAHSLEHLDLLELHSFVGIFDEWETNLRDPISLAGIFSCLRMIRIEKCHSIKKLFPIGLCSNMLNLERIYVLSCSQIEEIIADENDGIVILPKLSRIYLWSLPELKSICNGKMVCNSIKKVSINECG